MATIGRPVLVVEDDPFTRIVQVVLDPETSSERRDAFAHFFAHDLPDFEGWCRKVRMAANGLYPAEVRLVGAEEELRGHLPGAHALIVEAFEVAEDDLAVAPELVVVQKFGMVTRDIDVEACEQRGVRVRTLRRRANIACAEQSLAMVLALAKKLNRIDGLISEEQLRAAGYTPTSFDRRHTANSGWARIGGVKMLYESTLGIVGMGEIGRELARRAAPFGMKVLYFQRRRLLPEEERELQAEYVALEGLLAESDWVSIQLPGGPSTRGFVDAARLAQMRPGACLINTARAEIVDRDAVLAALTSGHLGGFGLDPQYEEPGRADDPLLGFDNVLLTPHTAAQPRFNALSDLEEMILGLAAELRPAT
jgi:phosphoglycerate dehydrogenase-like enzyme